MKYLLDVNALIAWHHDNPPEKKARIHAWAAPHKPALATCAISELGFIRVSMIAYNYTLEMAQTALAKIKQDFPAYIADHPPPRLAKWASTHRHTTDAYLCQLAAKHGMKLATFDTAIKDPAAFHIP